MKALFPSIFGGMKFARVRLWRLATRRNKAIVPFSTFSDQRASRIFPSTPRTLDVNDFQSMAAIRLKRFHRDLHPAVFHRLFPGPAKSPVLYLCRVLIRP